MIKRWRCTVILMIIFITIVFGGKHTMAAEVDNNASVEGVENVPYLAQTNITMYRGTFYNLTVQNQLPEAVVTMQSSDGTVVEVDSTGKLIAKAMGQAVVSIQIMQADHQYELKAYVVIYADSPTKIQLDSEQISLYIGEQLQLPYHLIPADATDIVSFTSDNPIVAAVDGAGGITAWRAGTAGITISLTNGEIITCTVTVNSQLESIQMLYLTDNKCTLSKGQSRTFWYKVLPDNVSDTKMIWKSDNEEIVTVDQQGKVTAMKTGKARITLEADDGSGIKAVITVKVKKRTKDTKSSETGLDIVNVTKARYTYTEMKKDLKLLQKKYGDCISVNVLSVSYDKRNIYEVVLGNPNAKNKIVIHAGIHGREYMTSLLTMKQIEFYCKNYYTGMYQKQYYNELFEEVSLHIVPMANPDGIAISQYGVKNIQDKKLKTKIQTICKRYGRGKASYYTSWKANARGVDINRNFKSYWSLLKTGVRKPCGLLYKGKSAESEIETKALTQLVNKVKPCCTISYHASGSVLYWDYGQKGSKKKEAYKLVDIIHDITKYEIKSGFHKKNSAGFSDWVSIKKKIPAVTIEIGKKSCPLKISKFNSIWKQNKMIYAVIANEYQ